MTAEARTYRFSDSQRPGLLLGLSARQAMPVVAGTLFLAMVLQAPVYPAIGLLGPVVGTTVAVGRWRGAPLAETIVPATRLWVLRRLGRHRWLRPPLLGDNTDHALPHQLRGLELLERVEATGMAVVRDRRAGTVTGVLRVRGHGFPLASGREQDAVLAGWSGAAGGTANPLAMILSAALLLRYVYSLEAESGAIESAVEQVLEDGLRTSDLARNGEGTVGTAEMGTAVAAAISHAEVGTDV